MKIKITLMLEYQGVEDPQCQLANVTNQLMTFIEKGNLSQFDKEKLTGWLLTDKVINL